MSSLYEGKIQLEEFELDFWRNPKKIQEHIQAFSFSVCSSVASQQPDEAIVASLCLNEFIKGFIMSYGSYGRTCQLRSVQDTKITGITQDDARRRREKKEKSGFDETFEQLVAQNKNTLRILWAMKWELAEFTAQKYTKVADFELFLYFYLLDSFVQFKQKRFVRILAQLTKRL